MTQAHFQTVTLNVRLREWVPEHEPREDDPHWPVFRATKVLLRKHDIPCWRCDVRYAGLVAKGEPPTETNPLAAYQLEAHHSDVEFSLLNAIDVAKWWERSVPAIEDPSDPLSSELGLVQAFSDVDGWLKHHPEHQTQLLTAEALPGTLERVHKQIFDAYMESEGNLMQLCDVCHRSKEQGIHHIDYPAWRVRAPWRADLPQHIT